jgi:hypothetical protein
LRFLGHNWAGEPLSQPQIPAKADSVRAQKADADKGVNLRELMAAALRDDDRAAFDELLAISKTTRIEND